MNNFCFFCNNFEKMFKFFKQNLKNNVYKSILNQFKYLLCVVQTCSQGSKLNYSIYLLISSYNMI